MDDTQRKMTKIAREVGKFTVQMMKEEGIGTGGVRCHSLRSPSSGSNPDEHAGNAENR